MQRIRRLNLKRVTGSWVFSLALVLMVTLSFRSAVADWNDVPTGSMKPTILIGDRIFVNKLAYDLKIPFTQKRLATWDHPDRADVVICSSPADGTRLVKRVIGIPGDTIEMRGEVLLINGRPMSYTAIDPQTMDPGMGDDAVGKQFFTENLMGVEHAIAIEPGIKAMRDYPAVTIPEGKYFVMGDNRDNSADSRYFGFVDRSEIAGKVTAVALSLDYDNYFSPRWGRFFSKLT
jgi:signal peptidase I